MSELNLDRNCNVNLAVQPLVSALREHAARYRVGVSRLDNGVTIIDAGIAHVGGLEAGRIISEICMGGLGCVTITSGSPFAQWPWQVNVTASHPLIACLASQYAGWSLSHGEGKGAFFALGSGPARAMGSKEPLFEELGYRTPAGDTVIVLEVDKLPQAPVADKIIERCGIRPEQLTIILTPTTSLAGGVQIVARVLEVALHKLHELKFPLAELVDGAASAPLPPPSPNFMKAMGRTNDAILFGGQVQLYVASDDDAARALAEQMPSSASRDFGKPFAEVFKGYGYDFYKVDPMLFSPAMVTVTNVKSGRSFTGGALNAGLLEQSFGA
ncbi:MAG: methenyltetrahydromethanopterin cyclohydrolase [Proteobacteria bacterium]|nr:methenyltetrahydromethanopterin cyclohydrolase [Pseudomonadota bacterium]